MIIINVLQHKLINMTGNISPATNIPIYILHAYLKTSAFVGIKKLKSW